MCGSLLPTEREVRPHNDSRLTTIYAMEIGNSHHKIINTHKPSVIIYLDLITPLPRLLLGKRYRASQIRKSLSPNCSQRKLQCLNSRRNKTIKTRWYLPRNKLIQQTSIVRRRSSEKIAALDVRREVQPYKGAIYVPTKAYWVFQVHLEYLGGDVQKGIWCDAVGPIFWDSIWHVSPGPIGLLLCSETANKISQRAGKEEKILVH